MLRAVLLSQLTLLWAVSVHAFYIWWPPYLCASDGTCPSVTVAKARSVEVEEPRALAESISFDLHQRTSQPVKDVARDATKAAGRLRKKYAALVATSPSQTQPELDRRATNTYSIQSAATPTASDSAGVDQDGTDYAYFIEVNVGSPGTPMYMLIDSGAGSTWVMGSSCASAACSLHNSFEPSSSTSWTTNSKTFSIAYGSGSVSGLLGNDTLSVADLKAEMTLGVANVTSTDFEFFPFDGILGLSLNSGTTENFLTVLKNQKLLTSNIFSVSLNRASDGTNTGEITFGATDPSKYTGSITYTPVPDRRGQEWAIALDDFGFDGTSAGVTGRDAYIDTGTSYAFGPVDDVAAIHKLIPGATTSDNITYTVPCSTSLDLTVTFSGVSYNVSRKDWVSSSSADCTSNFFGHEVVSGAWLLGDVFIKNVYTVFDWDNNQIGFAAKPALITTSEVISTVITSNDKTSTIVTTMTTAVPANPTTSSTSGTAMADSSAATATPTQASPAEKLGRNKYATVAVVCVVAAIAMVA